MRERTPRLVGVRKKPTHKRETKPSRLSGRLKSEKEEIYDIIYDACVYGYRFTDTYYGMPLIELDNLEEKGNGIYVIRFRCQPHELHHVHFGRMAEDVCKTLVSGMHFIHEFKREWGLPYEECVWIIQVGELRQETPIWKEIFMPPKTKKETIESKPHPKKCTHERWEEFLQSHYQKSLLSVAEALGYSKQNLDILGCDGKDQMQKRTVYSKHKKLFDAFLKDEWNKELMDGRNVLDYFKDLIASWIGEDLLVKALTEYGFTASLANADSDRVIKTERRQVTGEPDIKIEYEGNTRYLELMDALSPVEKYGQFDLRLSKAKNQFNKKTIFLLHGLADGKYILIDFMRDNITVTYNYPNPRFGNKPCSVVRFEDNGISMQGMAIFWESLKDIMLNTKPEPPNHILKMVDFQTGEVESIGTAVEIIDESNSSDSESVEEDMGVAETPPPTPGIAQYETDESERVSDSPNDGDIGEVEPVPDDSDESSVVAEDDEGQTIEYTAEQWSALNDGF